MKKNPILILFVLLLLVMMSCNLPAGMGEGEQEQESNAAQAPSEISNEAAEAAPVEEENETEAEEALPMPVDPPSEEVLTPEDLTYMGAFRLPEGSGGSDWDYSGHGLTYYPDGDPGGDGDGFAGSLFGVGHDQQLYVSEISIPEPVISKNLDDLNTAQTLQDFANISGGRFEAEEMVLGRMGIAYLPPQGDQSSAKLYYAYGQHIQDFEPSHGWSEITLSDPQAAGPWVFDGYSNYTTNDYIFEIPEDWAAAYTPGMRLATGRFREGVWGGSGPALYAYAPWNDGNPPADGATLESITPLLLYGVQEPGMPEIVTDESMQMSGYQESDHWWGAAWLTTEKQAAVIFTGTKAMGRSWYGFANGVEWDYDCVEKDNCPEYPDWPYDDRGFWAEDYQAQIVFFDPADLGKVALGQMETYAPQPYAFMNINEYMFAPELDVANYKRDIVGAAAYDSVHGYLYVIERLADEYKSVIHVWKVGG